ncbi:MAG: sensor histidine kinase [Bdellovibrionota bacterium]
MKRIRKFNFGFATGTLLIALAALLSYFSAIRLTQYDFLVTHTNEVQTALKASLSVLQDAETGERGFAITGKEAFLLPYRAAVAHVDETIHTLLELTTDNPEQQNNVRVLQGLANQKMTIIRRVIAMKQSTTRFKLEDYTPWVNEGQEVMIKIRARIGEMEKIEQTLLIRRRLKAQRELGITTTIIVLSGVAAVLLVIVATLLLNRFLAEKVESEKNVVSLNAQLAGKIHELENVNRELETFSYSVSHDLRAPLRGVIGFSKILLEDYDHALEQAAKDLVHRVIAASQRMGELIDGLLALSRLTRKDLTTESVDLSAMARSIISDLRKTQPDRDISISVAREMTTRGDSQLIYSVLSNLIGNAWKFTSKRTNASIEFGTTTAQEGKSCFFVRDNGVGFDMRYVQKLFGAFQRLHRSDEFEGTGIGLATTQRIIHRHGGKIWAEAALDRGATFFFTI